jgi:hypothetical protein
MIIDYEIKFSKCLNFRNVYKTRYVTKLISKINLKCRHMNKIM